MVDVEPAAPDDRCPQGHCESPEVQADYQEPRAEEHCRWGDRDCWGRHCSDRHCSDHRGAERSGFRERRAVGCSAVPDDYRSVGQDEVLRRDYRARSALRDVVLHRDFRARSVDPDDCCSAGRDEVLRRDFQAHLVDLDDCLDRLAVLE
jgi:hypothetical protein